ncbi:MAG: radical SAM protein [Butyrivibrio sp.]|nr:radical SAM protein [Butyrivibrio sp.]
MNYLIVMPRFIQGQKDNYIFPLGIAYVSASLKQVCDTVFCLNLNTHFGDIDDEIRNAIVDNDIDVIATGGLSPNFNQIRRIVKVSKQTNPDIITMVGGGLVTATPEVIMRGIPELDIGMIAEGEKTIQELHHAITENLDFSTVKGIVFRKADGTIERTPAREDIEDLDSLPFPDYDGFEFAGSEEISICTSRSCPFSCSFCFHTCGKKYRARSLDNIFKEIDWLKQKYDVKALGILDELFSINNERMHDFCERIKPYGIKWSCQMRVDRINLDTLVEMKEAGCTALSYGIESADNRVLESMEKHTTIEQVEKALDLSRRAGICPFGNLLIGDIADDKESFEKDLEWYTSHPDIQLGFNKVLVLPGSKLYKYAVKNGIIKDEVKYLEEENYAINLTRMGDEEYKKCLSIMDDVVARREYRLDDIAIKKTDRQNHFIGVGKCPLCGETIKIKTKDFLGTKNASCPNCGRVYAISLLRVMKSRMEKIISTKWKGKKVLIWGMGEEGYRFVYHCDYANNNNVYLADKNDNKCRKVEGKLVQHPEAVFQNTDIDLILIGTNAPVANNAIKKEAERLSPKNKAIYNLNDYLNMIAITDVENN